MPFDPVRHAMTLRLCVLAMWIAYVVPLNLAPFSFVDPDLLSGFGYGAAVIRGVTSWDLWNTPGVLLLAKWSAIASLAVAMLSRRLAPAAGVASLILVGTIVGIIKGLGGYANHSEIVPLIALAVVAACPMPGANTVGDWLFRRGAVRPADPFLEQRARVLIAGILVSVILPYTYIGLFRIFHGGFQIFANDAIGRYIASSSKDFSVLPAWLNSAPMVPVLSWGFAATTVLEVASIATLWSNHFRRAWLLWMLLFHVSTVALMNIFFWQNMVLLLMVFGRRQVDWSQEPLPRTDDYAGEYR